MKSCKECGACCKCWGIYELTQQDAKQISKKLFRKTHLYPNGILMKNGQGFSCIAYDKEAKCTIYENRPEICRRFRRNSIECKMAISQGIK